MTAFFPIVIHHNPDCATSRNVVSIVGVPDETLLDAMLEHPILVNRPLVSTPKGVRLCRPSETVLDLLDRLPPGPLAKEDGQQIIDGNGRRVV